MQYIPGITLVNRMVSGFPMSIGTSQAFESLFPLMQRPYDPERKLPEHVDPASYNSCYVNVSTLFRNMVSALDKGVFDTVKLEDVVATLEEEMGLIKQLFGEYAPGCKPIFYTSTYKTLKSDTKNQSVPIVQLREPTTEKQIYTEHVHQKTLEMLNAHTDSLVEYKDAIHPDKYEKSLVMTHFPYDLTGFKSFSQLDLLESNTGIVKPRYLWYTKLHPFGDNSLANMPFHRKTLLCFGDKSLIKPTKATLRQAVLDTASKRNWSPITTEDKINLDMTLSSMDPFVVAAWKAL